MGEYIKWFKDVSKNDVLKVGGKGAQLGEMWNLKVPVPQGFCITVDAYKKFLKESGISNEIYSILDKLNVDDAEELNEASEKIQELIIEQEVPEDIAHAIKESYNNLNFNIDVYKMANRKTLEMIRAGRDLSYVAIRSSANAEDQPETSFAGQNVTFLNIKGANNVVEKVKECWASLFGARCIYYKAKNNLEHRKVLIAVVVQKMVNSSASGVIFTINPTTNNKDEIVIEAGLGLGETVVSGAITPDVYLVNKNNLEIIDKATSKQEFQIIRDENVGGNVRRNLGRDGEKQKISNEIIRRLADYARQLEQHYNFPQDIEFAIEGNKIFIVQTRPVTTEKKIEEKKEEREEVTGKVLVTGIAAGPGIAKGKVKIVKDASELGKIEQGDVLVAKMTNPDYVSAMKRAVAVVTDEGGVSCHAAIVGREMGLAVVVGTGNATNILKDGMEITVDGYNGRVFAGEVEIEKPEEISGEKFETITKVKVNVDMPEYAEKAAATGADGVGLLRCEFLILKDKEHPYYLVKEGRKEELVNDLAEGVKEIAKAFVDKPVWYRTLDAPTDEFRHLKGGEDEPHEDNPMMGWRSIRRDLDQPELLKAQLEAIKKIHDEGCTNVGVMIPLVSHIEQIRKTKEYLKEIGLDCEFGVMVETPASVQMIEELCKEGIDFISFGTNDLTQFTLAVDRNNAKVQKLYDEMHPAVLRQMEHVIKVCKKNNVKTSICGQAGSREDMAEWLVKKGIDSISANIDAVKKIRRVVARTEKQMLLDAARSKE